MERTEPEKLDSVFARLIKDDPGFRSQVQSWIAEEVRRQLDSKHLTQNYYTPEELASHLKIKKQTVYSHVRKGLLKPDCPGRNMRFSFEAVQNYLR